MLYDMIDLSYYQLKEDIRKVGYAEKMNMTQKSGTEPAVEEGLESPIKKPRRKIIVVPLLLLLFIGVAFITFINSQVFDISNLEISGNRYLSNQEIIILAAVPEGQNIFTAPLRSIENNLLKIPRFVNVSITRRLPNTLEIYVEEKTTVAYIAYAGYFIEIDKEGKAIAVAEILTDMNVPIITNVNVTYVSVGDVIEPSETIANAAYVGKLLSNHGVSNLSEIDIGDFDINGNPKDISVRTSDGIKVLLGNFKGIEERVELLSPLLASLREGNKKPTKIDLRVETKPVVTY